MPYRLGKNLHHFYQSLSELSVGIRKNEAYTKHLEETVGMLFRMEEGGSGAESLIGKEVETVQPVPKPLPESEDARGR